GDGRFPKPLQLGRDNAVGGEEEFRDLARLGLGEAKTPGHSSDQLLLVHGGSLRGGSDHRADEYRGADKASARWLEIHRRASTFASLTPPAGEAAMNYGMHPGWIEVISGVMFSGKSEELIRRVRRATIARRKVQVFKSHLDAR